MINFDCAASAPSLSFCTSYMMHGYANPNSGHAAGREARKALEEARNTIARCIGASPEQIGFTPSATAACHFAMASMPHPVYATPNNHKAAYDFVNNELAASADTYCVAIPLVNNETGELMQESVEMLSKKNGKRVFVDATAAMGHVPVNVKDLGVESLAAGGHKFGAHPGIGFVYIRSGVSDDDSFPGTPPVGLAVGMAKALAYRMEYMVDYMAKLLRCRETFIRGIKEIPGAHINAEGRPHIPHIVSIRFDGVNARELLSLLDVNGLCASAGAACSAQSDEPSRVLLASGLTEEQAFSTVRFSFCEETPEHHFTEAVPIIANCVQTLRNLS